MNNSRQSMPGIMTADFQAALADLATNERRAQRYLDKEGRDLLAQQYTGCNELLNALPPTACRRVKVLAALLSERRLNRVVSLMPATKQLLGDNFTALFADYLASVEPGMPSATEEAVGYGAFLQARMATSGEGTALDADILRYEICLNEISRRVYHSNEKPGNGVVERPLCLEDSIQLSAFVVIERFSHDVVEAVKQLRAGQSVEKGESKIQSVLFRPKAATGLAVDVSVIPNLLQQILKPACQKIQVAGLLDEFATDIQQSLLAKLDYLLRADILVLCPPNQD